MEEEELLVDDDEVKTPISVIENKLRIDDFTEKYESGSQWTRKKRMVQIEQDGHNFWRTRLCPFLAVGI